MKSKRCENCRRVTSNSTKSKLNFVAVKARATWSTQSCPSLKILLSCQTRWRRLFLLEALYPKQILKPRNPLRTATPITWTLLRNSSWSVTCLWWGTMKILTTSKMQKRWSWLSRRSLSGTRCFSPSNWSKILSTARVSLKLWQMNQSMMKKSTDQMSMKKERLFVSTLIQRRRKRLFRNIERLFT